MRGAISLSGLRVRKARARPLRFRAWCGVDEDLVSGEYLERLGFVRGA
jgi:hypothetical protein